MNKANAIKHEAALLCRGSFPATLEENGEPCIVEASIYRLNAVAAAGFMLDGPESLLLHLGLRAFLVHELVDRLIHWSALQEDAHHQEKCPAQ